MKTIFVLLFVIFLQNQLLTQNLSWTPVNADLGISITDILQVNQNKLIIKSEKGVFIFTNFSDITRIDNLLPDTVKISCIALDTNKRLYAGTLNDGVFYFDESTNKWINISSKLENQSISYIAISNKNDIAVGTTNRGIYFFNSSDNTWSRLDKDQSKIDFSFLKYSDSGELFTIWNGTLYKITKNLSNQYLINGLYDAGCKKIKNIDFYNNKYYLSNDSCGLYLSSDTCKTWIKLIEGMDSVNSFSKVLITKNEEIITLSKTNGIYYTNNSSFTFEENNKGLTSLNVITGIILIDGKVMISIDSTGLFISEAPKNISIKQIGWINKGRYLERKGFTESVESIKISNDGTKIIAISPSEYKIWDVETGYLLKQYGFSKRNLLNAIISSDDSSILLIYENKFSAPSRIDSINTAIIDINNNQLIYNFPALINVLDCQNAINYSMLDAYANFNLKDKILFATYSYRTVCEGPFRTTLDYGKLFRVDFNSDSIKADLLFKEPVSLFYKTIDEKLIVLSDYNYEWFDNHMKTSGYSYRNKLIIGDNDLTKTTILYSSSKDEYNNANYDPIYKIHYLESKNELATLFGNLKLGFWDLNSNTLIDSCKFPRQPVTYVFSKNYKYIIAAFYTGIFILSVPEMQILDSIPLTSYAWKISVSPDSTTFAVGDHNGNIKLFKSSIITDVNKNNHPISHNSEMNKQIIYPNPGSDFINIQGISKGNIEIFSVEGVIIMELATESKLNLQIDISDLVPGFYFVKIDNQYYKFIKF